MRAKKEYKINSTLSMRLTEKAGVTDEVIEFLNELEQGTVSQEVFKAIKYWIRTQGENDRIRRTIEEEAMKMESKLARYGENRGPYKKHDSAEEIKRLKKELRRLESNGDEIENGTKKAIKEVPTVTTVTTEAPKMVVEESPLSDPVSVNVETDPAEYEDELFGGTVNSQSKRKKGNPLGKALNSIPRVE